MKHLIPILILLTLTTVTLAEPDQEPECKDFYLWGWVIWQCDNGTYKVYCTFPNGCCENKENDKLVRQIILENVNEYGRSRIGQKKLFDELQFFQHKHRPDLGPWG